MVKFVCIFLMAFACIFRASSGSYDMESSASSRATFIFLSWIKLYLKNPEFSAKLDAALTEDQQKTLRDISIFSYFCVSSNLDNDESCKQCLEKFMTNISSKEVDFYISTIRMIENRLPYKAIVDVSREYEYVFRFYTMLVRKTERGLILLNQFTFEEKRFIETLVVKYNNWFFHVDDVDAFADFAGFQRNNNMIQRVYKKIRQIKLRMKN